jgi:uncharacterized protein (TIRG00374 family)
MSRKLRTTVGVLLSLLLLAWAVRDVSFAEVLRQTRAADMPLFAASIILALGGFYYRALRWGFLLRPISGNIALRPRIAATFIGFAANNVLPARVGEFARAFSLERLAGVRAAAAFATLVIERLLDGLVLVALLFAAMAAPGFPSGAEVAGLDLQSVALTLALIMGVVGIALFLAVARPSLATRIAYFVRDHLPERLKQPFIETMRSFATGLAVLRSARLFVISLLLAVGQWLFLALSYWVGFRAFGMTEIPFSGAVFLQSLISLAVAIPSSPGFFGPFEAAARVGLGLWDVSSDRAISFAIGYHIGGFLPVVLIGVYYVWVLNLRWSDVRHSEEVVEEAIHHLPGEPALGDRSGA